MRNSLVIFALIIAFICYSFFLESCRKRDYLGSTTPVDFVVPPGFPQPQYDFASNPLNKETIELGRHLFYEGKLSKNGQFDCGSCHQQVAAFTTFEHDRSHGYNNSHTLRNAPGLFNIAWLKEYEQDGGSKTLEALFLKHITDQNEMAETVDGIINKLRKEDKYKKLFGNAFGEERITGDRIFIALKQFVLTLVSADSKYDKMKRGEYVYDASEANGYQIFQSKCATCHTEPLFTDLSYRNIGLTIDPQLNDFGRMRVTNNRNDSLKFRVPSLRNVYATSYYTHDGRYSTITHILNHYRNGIIQGPTLDPLLQNGIQLTTGEMNDLFNFLRTLTDTAFINNPSHSIP
jgi:cytochrome c peroxidase